MLREGLYISGYMILSLHISSCKMKASLACWLFLFLVAVATPPFSQSVRNTYLIRPNTSTPCPLSTADRCLTLQEFAEEEEPKGNTTIDITLELMSGVHNLLTSVVVESIQSFSMYPLFCDSEVEVTCSTSAGMTFRNISKYLSIIQISYSYCGADQIAGAIRIESANHVQLSQVTITHSPGSAMVVSNASFVSVNSTVVIDSNATGFSSSDSTVNFTGNNTFMYNSGSALSAFTSDLYFNGRTIFKYNTADFGGGMNLSNSVVELSGWVEFVNNAVTAFGGAIHISCGSMNIPGVVQFSRNTAQYGGGAIFAVDSTKTFNISGNATFARNQARVGGAIYITHMTATIQFVGSTVFDGNSATYGGALLVEIAGSLNFTGTIVFSGNLATFGSAMVVQSVSSIYWSGWALIARNRAYENTIYIKNCSTVVTQGEHTFQNNVAMQGTPGMCLANILHLQLNGNTTFLNNSGRIGGALWMINVNSAELNRNLTFVGNLAEMGGSMVLENTKFISRESSVTLLTNNHAVSAGGAIFLYQSTLSIQSGTLIAENNSAGINGGAVCSSAVSEIVLNATVKFINNSAAEGGAYYQTVASQLILGNKANVQFLNNRAEEKGGAIFSVTENFCGINFKRCFFQIQTHSVKVYFIFKNNSATVSGNVLYGGWIEECLFEAHDEAKKYNFYDISYISDSIGANNLTTIASDPYKICPCMNGTLQCSTKSVALPPMYPGQAFIVSVIAVGQEHGTVPSSVVASLGKSNASVKLGQISQTTAATCTSLIYTLFSQNKNENLSLTAVEKCQYTSPELLLKISLLECPKGFELSGSPPQCVCQERLLQYTQKCTIDDQKIHRTTNFWLGYDNATRGLVLHPHCPFDYCTPPPNNFTVEHSDLQCSYNRTRLLCGQCQPGFSLALGTSRCLRCSNYYLALLPVFAVAGLALVVLLFACKLTLARGTINGLVFYANLVHSNRTLYFPTGETNVMNVFIAWLNLDLGLETCLYNGMDTYARMWLQFAFPLYVWVLCGCIVFISSKSYRMSRVLGTNPVAVLATLFLLSYTKLLHTAFAALSFTTLSYPQCNTKLVWLYDANIEYLRGKHIPLFVVGLAALLLCLPYTLLLLTGQWLRAWSNHRFFHWVNSPRLKFLLDAHNAPFKTKHCYWTGLLLLTRLMLYFVDAVNVLGNGCVNILATCIAVAALAVWMGVSEQPYKSRLLGAIEELFLLNVLILSVSTLYIRLAQGNQAALAYTSTTLFLAMFVAILLFHAYSRIKQTNMWKTLTAKRLTDTETGNQDEEDDEQMVASGRITHLEIVLPRHTGYAERTPVSQMTERDIRHNLNSESQLLQQHERAPAPPEPSGSIDSCSSSQQSWDNLSTPYTEAELREPLLSMQQ